MWWMCLGLVSGGMTWLDGVFLLFVGGCDFVKMNELFPSS